MIFKTIAGEVKDIDAMKGVVRFYGAAFGNEDSQMDVIQPGTFRKTIEDRGPKGSNRIKVLYQHDPWKPIGIPLELVEDSHGLMVTAKIAATMQGKDVLVLYEAGVINEHSIGGDVLRRDETDRRNILEMRLWEISPVTWGANPLTPLLDLKAETIAFSALQEQVASMKSALRSGLSDGTAKQLELAVGIFEAHLMSLRDAAQAPDAEESAPAKVGGHTGSHPDSAIAPLLGELLLLSQLRQINQRV